MAKPNPHNEEGHQDVPGAETHEKSPERNAERAGRPHDHDDDEATTHQPGRPGTAERD